MRDFAGDDIDLIAVGERHQDVGIGDAGGFEHRRIGAITRHRADIQPILQIAQHVLVGIDHRDFIRRLAREVVGRGAPDLAGAQYQDLHEPWTPNYITSRFAY